MNEKDFLRLEGKIDALMRHLGCTGAPRAQGTTAPSGPMQTGEVASDHDLDGERGDPTMKFQPRDCKSPVKGKKYSQCSADDLDVMAESLEYFAKKNDASGAVDGKGGPKSKWDRLDAARARGWAARIRGGWKAPKSDDPDWVTGDIDDGSADAWHSQHDT